MESRPGTAVVSGITGFIGGVLTERLLHDGWKVVAVARPEADLSLWQRRGVEVVRDHKDVTQLTDQIAAHAPNSLFHLATRFLASHRPADVPDLIESNIAFGARLAEAAVAVTDCRFISAATSWQHLGGADYAPVSLYAATKQAFGDLLTHYGTNAGLPVTVLTLFDTYGQADPRPKLMPLLLRALATGERLEMTSGNQFIDLTEVHDVADAFVRSARADVPAGTWTVSSGAPLRVRDLIDLISELAGRRLNIELGARPDRANEMWEPWIIGQPLPGWLASTSLRDGLLPLVRQAMANPPLA
jgi:nucleoside-diphosphate-sugar epimerase